MDAHACGMCAMVQSRSEDNCEQTHMVSLMDAKTRVAPLDGTTIAGTCSADKIDHETGFCSGHDG